MKLAICIGHSRSGDMGAESVVGGISEWNYNLPVGEKLQRLLALSNVPSVLIPDYRGSGYSAAMDDAARQIKDSGADLAIELHFNSASPSAEGFEYLHYIGSTKSASFAAGLVRAHAERKPDQVNRGAKPKSSGDRGAGFLIKTHCPAVIAEPFFGSNREEWKIFADESGQDALAGIYAAAVCDYYGVAVSDDDSTEDDQPTDPFDPSVILDSVGEIERQCQTIRNQLS